MSNFLTFLSARRRSARINGFHMRLIGLSLLVLGFCQALSAQEAVTQLPLDEQLGMTDMPSVGPLFVSTDLFTTHISLVNAGNADGSGVLFLRGLDGGTLLQQNLTVKGHSSVSLDVKDLLSTAGSGAQQGRVEFYGMVDSSAIAGQLTLSYIAQGHTHLIDEELMMPSVKSSSMLRGIAVGSTDSPLVAVANPGLFPEDVTAACYPENGPNQTIAFRIPAGQTMLLHGCVVAPQQAGVSWLGSSRRTSAKGAGYAMELQVNTPHGEIEAFGLSPASLNSSNDWTSMNFFDPARIASPLTIFAGVPFGNTPLLWGAYDPQVAIHNFSDHVQIVNLALDATLSGFAVHTTLKSFSLQPNESRTLDIFQGAGSSELLNTITVTGSDPSGGLVSQLMLRNTALNVLVQLVGKSGADDTNIGMHPWKISDTEDSVLLLYNQTKQSREIHLKIGNGSAIWEKTVSLSSLATQTFSIKGLLGSHSLDDKGLELMKGAGYGEISWAAERPGYIKGRLLRLNSSTQTAESFQCAAYQTACNATIYGPSSMNEGQSANWSADAQSCINNLAPNYCFGTPTGSTSVSSYGWSVSGGLSSTGSLNSSSVTAQAVGGTGYLNVNMTAYNGCVISASQKVTVAGYPGATISSVYPPVWVAGSNFFATITGTNFGSNPSVSLVAPGVRPSATTVASNGNTINVPVSVAPNAPNGPVAITVIPGYPGTSYICGSACNGGNGYGTAGAVVQAVTPTPQIMFNGQNISGTTQAVMAGQQIALSLAVPPGYSIQSQSWRFSNQSAITGGWVNGSGTIGSQPSRDTGGSEAIDPPLNQPAITFYWTNPGDNGETISCTYTLDNGQTSSATATFNIGGPSGNFLLNAQMQAAANGVVVSGISGSQILGTANQPLTIRSGSGGIQFTTSATPPSGANASFMWVQLIAQDQTRVISSAGDRFANTALPGLDGTYPYFAWNSYGTYDTPASQLPAIYGELWRAFDATMYLMWDPALPSGCKPATTSSDGNYIQTHSTCTSTPIPLSSIRWRYQGCAVNTLTPSSGPWVKQCGTDQVYAPIASGYPSWGSTVNPIGTLQ